MINESVRHTAHEFGCLNEAEQEIEYIEEGTPEDLRQAADLINQGGQLVITMTGDKLAANTRYILLAKDDDDVVGVAAIKNGHPIAEIGYTAVHPDYRRHGIAQELTQRRIHAARDIGVRTLYAAVRQTNRASRNNLRKAGFIHYDDRKSPHSANMLSWYYYPVSGNVTRSERDLEQIMPDEED